MSEADQEYVEGLGDPVFPPGVDPLDYPPYTLSASEEAATVGRYRDDQVAESPPTVDLTDHEYATGRTVAAPQGVVYTRDETDESAERSEGVSVYEAAVAAQSVAVRSATPDMVEPEEGDHLSDREKGAKSGSFESREAPEVGFGALPEGTVDKLDEKNEEEVLARQGQKTPDQQVLAQPAKPATDESVEKAFEVTAEAEKETTELDAADVGQESPDLEDNLTRSPEEQAEAVAEAEPDEPPSVLDQKIEGSSEESDSEEESWDAYTVPELKAELDSRGLAYESKAVKADLVKQLEEDDEA